MDLYIFRHGETYHTKNKVPYGKDVETAEILPDAYLVIKKMALYLKGIKTEVNYTSPYLRCVQTTQVITQITGQPYELEKRLSEFRTEYENKDQFIGRVKGFLLIYHVRI